jgi:hypothetical protein
MITNIYNLPERFLNAVENDPYSKGHADYSITELLSPPQVSLLKNRYEDQIEEDVTDHIWKLFGKAVHNYIDQQAGGNEVSEGTFFADLNGFKIKGTADSYIAGGRLDDYKVTNVYTVQRKSREQEWFMQVNGYAWLLRQNGIEINELRIIGILRDWMQSKAGQGSYPVTQVVTIDVPIMSDEEIEAFYTDRINLYEINKDLPDSLLKECTAGERWNQNRRCQDYCPASKFCKQYEKILKDGEEK